MSRSDDIRMFWDFIIKYERWFSALVVIGLDGGKNRKGEMWTGNLACLFVLISRARLAMHPMIWRTNEK